MRIGFLFNHDQIHQVAHSLPIAIAMAKGGFAGEIIVATTNEQLAAEVRRLAGEWLGSKIQHLELSLSPRSVTISRLLEHVVPATKLLVYRDNLDFFRSLDMLVVAEKTSLLLKSRYGLDNLFIIHTRHGAGDRAIGFDKASARFDHVLCSGEKIRRRLIAEAGVDPDAISIVGYPKFDMIRQAGRSHHVERDRPVVLYNPHPSPHLSSWYKHGRQVLDHFRRHDDQELLFAPHVMLFQRPFVVTIDKLTISRAGAIDNRYLHGDNIHIDLGSRASTDMSYTMAADIYLGDASSQVYEFLLRPRPCIFLNSHRIRWEGDPNFAHWEAGEVISDPAELTPALDRAAALHDERYRAKQEAMFADSFDLNGRPSSERAAEVIVMLAERRRADRISLSIVRAA
jgi:CDP-glycerol glycerophosphotransferase (TagB/SpsB family)